MEIPQAKIPNSGIIVLFQNVFLNFKKVLIERYFAHAVHRLLRRSRCNGSPKQVDRALEVKTSSSFPAVNMCPAISRSTWVKLGGICST